MEAPVLTIYNVPPQPPNWDRVGVFYIVFCGTWTIIVAAGMVFCWLNRQLPILKVRGLGLSFAAVICLHLYWILAQITYPIGATMPIVTAYSVQYFVMSTWFPLGIALFHASNLRFLYIAKRQKQFSNPSLSHKRGCNGGHSSWLCKIRNLNYDTKVKSFIAVGLVVQALLTVGMWVACRKYHPSFGIPGTEIRGNSLPEQLRDLGIGWEWWPSVVWQFVWTWGVAPSLIWRAWNIRDTMGWRTQTIGACLSGLHATPMFLISSYVPAFYKVNPYFSPSQWIHLHTMFLECFIIFVPAYQVLRLRQTNRKVTYSNEKWETLSQATTIQVVKEKGSAFEVIDKDSPSRPQSNTYPGDRLLTMTALTRVLDEHPQPLQQFSACNDFSGENISFLTRVAAWKNTWSHTPMLDLPHPQRTDMYNAALAIYIDLISPRDAEFPINLSSAQLKHLESIFESSARHVCGEKTLDPSVPFAFGDAGFDFELPASRHSGGSEEGLRARYEGEIDGGFDAHVFDGAYGHVKDLVLMNTWPKFVREMRRRRMSGQSDKSDGTQASMETKGSRVSQLVKTFCVE